MKKLIAMLLILAGCQSSTKQPSKEVEDSLQIDTLSAIERICMDANSDNLTLEEAAHWDSMNTKGGCLYVRGAERYLDTIVNHYHIVFIPEP